MYKFKIFMNLLTFVLYFLNFYNIVSAQLKWINNLYDSFNNMKPHQVVIYKNKTTIENVIEIDSILDKLQKTIPLVLRDLSFSRTKYFDSNGLVVYLQQEAGSNNTQILDFINFYEKQYRKQPRQKCLIIFSTKKALRKSSIKNILRFAWQKKFLDFTVLEIFKNSDKAFFHTFNPFFNTLYKKKFSDSIELFPNKLRDLNKYPLILPIYSHEPYINLVNNSAGEVRAKSFLYDSFLLTALKEMNFKLKFERIDYVKKTTINIYTDIFNKLENYGLNMDIVPSSSTIIPASLPILFLHSDCTRTVGVMKYQSSMKFVISPNTLIYFSLFMSFVFFIKFIIFLFKITAYNFDVLDVIRIAAATPLNSLPKTLCKRMIVIVALFSSMLFSAEFFTFLTKVVHVNDEVSFNSIEEIFRSKFKLITTAQTYKIITNSINDKSKELFSQYVKADDSIKCPYYALENSKIICVVSAIRVKEAIKSSKKLAEIMKILPFDFFCANRVYPFEAASPYLNYFELIFGRMYESGIFNYLSQKFFMQTNSQILKRTGNKEFEGLLVLSLVLILGLGTITSFIVFISEVIFYRFTAKRFSLQNLWI